MGTRVAPRATLCNWEVFDIIDYFLTSLGGMGVSIIVVIHDDGAFI